MASSSMLCTEEELQKARDDLKELLARSPIPDEFKSPTTSEDEEEKVEVGKKKNKKKKKKKKVYVLPQQDVETLLNWEFSPLPKHEALAQADEEDKEQFKDARALARVADVFIRHDRDFIRCALEKMRHDYETNGCITYEATDDGGAEEEDESAMLSEEGGGAPEPESGAVKLD